MSANRIRWATLRSGRGCRAPSGAGGLRGQDLIDPFQPFGGERWNESVRLVAHSPPVGPGIIAARQYGLEVQRHFAVARQQRDGDYGQGGFELPSTNLDFTP